MMSPTMVPPTLPHPDALIFMHSLYRGFLQIKMVV